MTRTTPTWPGVVAETGANLVVVGLPLSLSGRAGPAAKEVELEVAELRRALPVPVELCDERFSTVVAHRSLIGGRAKGTGAPPGGRPGGGGRHPADVARPAPEHLFQTGGLGGYVTDRPLSHIPPAGAVGEGGAPYEEAGPVDEQQPGLDNGGAVNEAPAVTPGPGNGSPGEQADDPWASGPDLGQEPDQGYENPEDSAYDGAYDDVVEDHGYAAYEDEDEDEEGDGTRTSHVTARTSRASKSPRSRPTAVQGAGIRVAVSRAAAGGGGSSPPSAWSSPSW